MRLASCVISFCLHAGFVLLVLFWPSPPPHRPDPQAMTVSLVDGLPGGNRAPSPILGPQGAPAQRQAPPLPSKEPPQPVAAPVPVQEKPPPKPEAPKPVPKPVPEPEAALLANKKKDEPKKPEPKPQEPPKPTPPKPTPPKETPKKTETPKPAPPKADPVKEALDKAAKAAAKKNSPGELKVEPNVVARALTAARKQSGGHGGGGGGEGVGAGGDALGDAYAAQIVRAVQPNWESAPQTKSLSVVLYLKMDAAGRVLDVRVTEPSGNKIFDSTAVSAVWVTQVLPQPPSPAYLELEINFFPTQ